MAHHASYDFATLLPMKTSTAHPTTKIVLLCLIVWARAAMGFAQTDDATLIPTQNTDSAIAEHNMAIKEAPMLSVPTAGYAIPLFGSYLGWELHKGLNAELGMSLTTGLGQGRMKGVGFGQHGALAYAMPLSRKLAAAAGLYASHLQWGSHQITNVGLAAIVAYEWSERCTLYAYATHQLNKPRPGRPVHPMAFDWGQSSLGAGLDLKLSDHVNIGFEISISDGTPWRDHIIHGRHMKPYGW